MCRSWVDSRRQLHESQEDGQGNGRVPREYCPSDRRAPNREHWPQLQTVKPQRLKHALKAMTQVETQQKYANDVDDGNHRLLKAEHHHRVHVMATLRIDEMAVLRMHFDERKVEQ